MKPRSTPHAIRKTASLTCRAVVRSSRTRSTEASRLTACGECGFISAGESKPAASSGGNEKEASRLGSQCLRKALRQCALPETQRDKSTLINEGQSCDKSTQSHPWQEGDKHTEHSLSRLAAGGTISNRELTSTS